MKSSRSPSRLKDKNFEKSAPTVNLNITRLQDKKPSVDLKNQKVKSTKTDHTRNNTDAGIRAAVNQKHEVGQTTNDAGTIHQLEIAIQRKNKPVAFLNKNYLMMTKMTKMVNKGKSRHESMLIPKKLSFNNGKVHIIPSKFRKINMY